MEQSNVPAIQSVANVNIGIPTAQEMAVYDAWANNAVDSNMYRSVGKASAIMMIMLAAREYGIGPAQALNGGIHIIEGKVELSARMMSSLIRKQKHQILVVEESDEICTLKGIRSDTKEEQTVSFTIEMAQKGGLIKEKGAWKKTPEDMLYARALSRLARRLFSDVVGVGYIQGEISDSRASNEVLDPIKEQQPEIELKVTSLDAKPTEGWEELITWFPEDRHEDLAEYVDKVRTHFKWTNRDTVLSLLKDKSKTISKFNTWLETRK
jgi:hypothetical protein